MPFIDEIAGKIQDADLATLNTDMFLSTKHTPPVGLDKFLVIVDTGGSGQVRVHDSVHGYDRPTAQILAKAPTYPEAYALAISVWNYLDGLDNVTIDGVRYVKVRARQLPTDIGLDIKKRAQSAFNIEAMKDHS